MCGALFPCCARPSSFSHPTKVRKLRTGFLRALSLGCLVVGKGLTLPVGDSPVGRGGGSGGEIAGHIDFSLDFCLMLQSLGQ